MHIQRSLARVITNALVRIRCGSMKRMIRFVYATIVTEIYMCTGTGVVFTQLCGPATAHGH